jgi:hypothetical protein
MLAVSVTARTRRANTPGITNYTRGGSGPVVRLMCVEMWVRKRHHDFTENCPIRACSGRDFGRSAVIAVRHGFHLRHRASQGHGNG